MSDSPSVWEKVVPHLRRETAAGAHWIAVGGTGRVAPLRDTGGPLVSWCIGPTDVTVAALEQAISLGAIGHRVDPH